VILSLYHDEIHEQKDLEKEENIDDAGGEYKGTAKQSSYSESIEQCFYIPAIFSRAREMRSSSKSSSFLKIFSISSRSP
jgi:hypothetical protein